MAVITKNTGAVSLADLLLPANCQKSSLVAGEALARYDACYISAADGKVYKSTSAAANDAVNVYGYAADDYETGRADVTLVWDVHVPYGTAMTPGKRLYLDAGTGAAAGKLNDATQTNAPRPIGYTVTGTIAFLKQFLQ